MNFNQEKLENLLEDIADFLKLDPRRQSYLITHKWPGDIARQAEQLKILEGILNKKG